MKIEKRSVEAPFGVIELFRLENAGAAWVELSSLGAGIIGLGVPDREGRVDNVVLAYADPADYMADGPCMGKCPGRYANRIAGGHLEVAGKTYRLAVNNGPNHLHGGPGGFQNHLWQARELVDGVEFTYGSQDGEENYPGNLSIKATYRWNDDNVLTLKFEAETDADTVINLTNHGYWNLRGAESGCAFDHLLKIKAGKWLPTDSTLVPTGDLEEVADTPMDFREFKAVGKDIKADFPALNYGKGYDNCWALDGWKPGLMVENAVELCDPVSGRTLAIDTDQPGVQIYTSNWMGGSPRSRGGREFADYDAVAIEPQGFPDAPNKRGFPTQWLRPGEKYERTIRFRFGRQTGK